MVCFSSLSLFFSTAGSQEIPPAQNFHQWGAVTLFSGLPSDNVRAVAQTADGILWFGTDDGLARFDGRRVQTVALEGLGSNKILTLAIGLAGEIWVGTSGGAGRFFGGRFYPIRETLGKPVTAILPGEISTLVSGDTVFSAHHNSDNLLETIVSHSRPLELTSVVRFDGKLFFGSRGRGLIIEENGELQEVSSRPRAFFVNALRLDANGGLWIGAQGDKSGGGLFRATDVFRSARIPADVGTVTAIFTSENGDVWVGTEKRGLFRFRGEQLIENYTFENTAGGLRSNMIYSIFGDREGVLWVGTNRGASRFDAASPFSQTLSAESPNSNFVRTIYQTRGGQILAGTNRGLFTLDGSWNEAENLKGKTVYAVAEDASGQLLIGASTGVFDANGKQKMPGDVRAFAAFQNRIYAAVFGRGIVALDDANQPTVFPNNTANTLFADAGKLWIATTKGEFFTFDGKDTKPENSLASLRGAAIRKITRDADSNLWFGGERGLFRYKDGELQNVIADRDVRDIIAVGTEIWAATVNGGLVHLKPETDFGWLAVSLDVEQGLPSEQIFALLPQTENRLLVGTNRGVVNYAPSRVVPNIVAARVLSQRLHGAEELASVIKLEYPQNSLLVEVAGISSRTFPEQFQYAFYLKNAAGETLDKKLSSDAQYAPADLAAGEYQIEARAFNKDLLASEPLIIRFSIDREPFPWIATALGALLAVAIAALIWAGIERKRISQRNRQLAAARFDLANEAERERKRIARDLHDQTLADLRNLMLMSDRLPSETSDFRREVESISTEIRRICEDLSPSVLENVGLAPALEFLVSHTIENYEFTAAENLEEKMHFTAHEQMQIYRIAQEVLNNIKRHSDAKRVKMRVEISEASEFILSIFDDGTAFAPVENLSKGRGIANIKSRAALIEAVGSWQTDENGETLFQLKKSEPAA